MSKDTSSVAVIGSGSWATALVKLLQENNTQINWYFRKQSVIDSIKSNNRNPDYLSDIELDISRINFFTNLDETIKTPKIVILAIPSAYLKESLSEYKFNLKGKYVFSAIKGIIPNDNLPISAFLHKYYDVTPEMFGVITGPCHSEEIALEKLSYLTIATTNTDAGKQIVQIIETPYLKTITSDDVYGAEYASVLKNIISIAAGISYGLGYGDNYQAVLVANAFQEIKRFLEVAYPFSIRQINSSAYLGDLLVTTYSAYSRNRRLGILIGKGHSVRTALLEMNMVAEGYFATSCMNELSNHHHVNMPIIETVYRILYTNSPAGKEMAQLSEKMS